MTLERGNAFTPVASATMIWPTGIATGAGIGVGALAFLVSLPAITIAGPLGWAIFTFALVGGSVALLGNKGDRRARRYAGQYPFRFALAPALLGGGGVALATALGGAFFGGLFAGIGVAAVLWVILGVIGMVAGNKN